jgi:hypothetical protein
MALVFRRQNKYGSPLFFTVVLEFITVANSVLERVCRYTRYFEESAFGSVLIVEMLDRLRHFSRELLGHVGENLTCLLLRRFWLIGFEE